MRFDKLTTKFQAALQAAQSQAMAADNAYLEASHVLKALLDDNESGMTALLVQCRWQCYANQTRRSGCVECVAKSIRAGRRNVPKS